MADSSVLVRPAAPADAAALGVMGAAMVRLHYGFDPQRFMAPTPHLAAGYGHFLTGLVSEPDALVIVAEVDGTVAGYLYGSIEPRSWEELREPAGFVHDILVSEGFRGRGIADRLMEHALAWFGGRGMPRVVLHTAERNATAQRLFGRLGFRRTMIEMTRELD